MKPTQKTWQTFIELNQETFFPRVGISMTRIYIPYIEWKFAKVFWTKNKTSRNKWQIHSSVSPSRISFGFVFFLLTRSQIISTYFCKYVLLHNNFMTGDKAYILHIKLLFTPPHEVVAHAISRCQSYALSEVDYIRASVFTIKHVLN